MGRSHSNRVLLVVAALTSFLVGCGGLDYHYDSGPAPAWIRNVETKPLLARGDLQALGMTPATTQPGADLDRAHRDALDKIAQMICTRVQSQLTSWTMEESRGGSVRSHFGAYQRITLLTDVKVEDYRVESSYRDEETQSAYVLVSVNPAAWGARLQKRIESLVERIEKREESAAGGLDAGRPLQAYAEILEAYRAESDVIEDVAVIEVLAPQKGLGKRVARLGGQLDAVSRRLTDSTRIHIEVECPDRDAARICESGIAEILASRGFQVGGSEAGNIRIRVRLGSRYLRSERVANRTEHIAAAEGELTIVEPDGTAAGNLAVSLPPERHTERAPGREAALQEALRTAANRIRDGFRSRFRLAYPMPE